MKLAILFLIATASTALAQLGTRHSANTIDLFDAGEVVRSIRREALPIHLEIYEIPGWGWQVLRLNDQTVHANVVVLRDGFITNLNDGGAGLRIQSVSLDAANRVVLQFPTAKTILGHVAPWAAKPWVAPEPEPAPEPEIVAELHLTAEDVRILKAAAAILARLED